MIEYHRYAYNGPVFIFENCAARRWKAETMAVSKEKALINFKHQYKQGHKLEVNSKINLPGKIEIID